MPGAGDCGWYNSGTIVLVMINHFQAVSKCWSVHECDCKSERAERTLVLPRHC